MNCQVETVYDDSPATMPEIPFSKGESNRELLHAAWRLAGIRPIYPADTRTVFALLKVMQYRIDRNLLQYVFRRGYANPPAKRSGELVWVTVHTLA